MVYSLDGETGKVVLRVAAASTALTVTSRSMLFSTS